MNNLQSNKTVTKCCLFCGVPGAGKTTALFKTYSVLYKRYREKVQVITLDSYSVKGRYECEKFCGIGQVEFKTIGSNARTTSSKPTNELLRELEELLLASDEKIIRLIDFSGVKYQFEWVNAFKTTAGNLSKKIEVFINYCIPAFADLDLMKSKLETLKKEFDQQRTAVYLTHCDNPMLLEADMSKIKSELFNSAMAIFQYTTKERMTRLFATNVNLYLGIGLHKLGSTDIIQLFEMEHKKYQVADSKLTNFENCRCLVHYEDFLGENDFILHYKDTIITETVASHANENAFRHLSRGMDVIISTSDEI